MHHFQVLIVEELDFNNVRQSNMFGRLFYIIILSGHQFVNYI